MGMVTLVYSLLICFCLHELELITADLNRLVGVKSVASRGGQQSCEGSGAHILWEAAEGTEVF